MKRLYMTVEGQTEAAFASNVLAPHLESFDVFLFRPRYSGLVSRKSARIPRGGLKNTFLHTLSDMRNWMKQDRHEDARFTTMIDLYSIPRDFPGYENAMSHHTGAARAESLCNSLANELRDQRFIPYIQVYEFEALVLVEPERIKQYCVVSDKEIRRLVSECSQFSSPEEIDGGTHSHPKFRIKKRIPKYRENILGHQITQDIGLHKIRQRCPSFGKWLTTLEALNE